MGRLRSRGNHLRRYREQRRRILVVGNLEVHARRLERGWRRRVHLQECGDVSLDARFDAGPDPPVAVGSRITDQKVTKRKFFAAKLPRVDVANDSAATSVRVDDTKTERVVAGFNEDFSEVVARGALLPVGNGKDTLISRP